MRRGTRTPLTCKQKTLSILLYPILLPVSAAFYLVLRCATSRPVERYCERRGRRDPTNPTWPYWLALLHLMRLRRSNGKRRQSIARRALEHYRRWFALDTNSNDHTPWLYAMRIAVEVGEWEEAQRYAEFLQQVARQRPVWGYAHHHAHIGLGHVALHRGDIDQAREHLRWAGEMLGSPEFGDFAPHFSLAGALLQHGERDTVLAFLERCGRFWKSPRAPQCARWSRQIQAGKTPDFGRWAAP